MVVKLHADTDNSKSVRASAVAETLKLCGFLKNKLISGLHLTLLSLSAV